MTITSTTPISTGSGRWTALPAPVRALVLVLASLVLALGFVSASATSAQARPDDGVNTGGYQSVCAQASFSGNASMLPAMRWDDASTHLHSRLGGALWDDVPQKVQRSMYTETLLSVGNFFWSAGAGFTEKSSRFCPLDAAGGTIDNIAGKVGTAILKSTIPLLGVLIAVVGFLWRKRSRGGSPKEMIGAVVIIAIMAVMVGGATQSSGGGLSSSSAAFKPGTLSPGWFVTKTDALTSALASAPAAAIGAVELNEPEEGARDALSCYAYDKAMKDQYKTVWGTSGNVASSMPLIISGMWEQSGMLAWQTAQFGDNAYGKYMSCRLLESFASTPFAVGDSATASKSENSIRGYLTAAGVDTSKFNADALAFRQANDPVERDRQMIGWAACRLDGSGGYKFSSDKFVAKTERDPKKASILCGNFFTKPGWDGDEFDAPVDQDKVAEQTEGDREVTQFINVLHGKDSMGGPVAAFAYALSGVSVLVVFGLMALAVIVAKLAALALMLTLFAVMTMAIFTRDGLDRVWRFAKSYIGLSFFVFASSLVMAMLATITKVCMSIGGSLLSGSGLVATMWAGLSPLLAVLILVQIFKKAKIPSPFSLKGGLAWGAAAGGAGAATAIGLDRLTNGARRRAGQMGRNLAGATIRRGTGYRGPRGSAPGTGRTSRIAPEGTTPAATSPTRPTRSRRDLTREGAASRVDHRANPSVDPGQQVDVGVEAMGSRAGTVAERHEANKGKVTAGDVQDHWRHEMEPEERAVYEKRAAQAARWQTVGAAGAAAKGAAAAVLSHKRRAVMIGLGLAAAPLALSGLGAVALAGGAVAAAGAGVGGAVVGINRARQRHMIRRTTATQSAQMDALRDHLTARQAARRSEPRDPSAADDTAAQTPSPVGGSGTGAPAGEGSPSPQGRRRPDSNEPPKATPANPRRAVDEARANASDRVLDFDINPDGGNQPPPPAAAPVPVGPRREQR